MSLRTSAAFLAFLAVLPLIGGPRALQAGTKPLASRIAEHGYPAPFQAWNGITNQKELTENQRRAKHDFYWDTLPQWGLKWEGAWEGEGRSFTSASLAAWTKTKNELLELNPNMVLIAEVRYFCAPEGYLPETSKCWQHDAGGKRIPFCGQWKLDFKLPAVQDQVVAMCAAACALFDGVMLDCWVNDNWADSDKDKTNLVKKVREKIGADKIVIVNNNQYPVPNSAPYVNGLFMECSYQGDAAYWAKLSETLRWAETSLREPRTNCIETWATGANQANVMRALNTLAMTHSNGYGTFCEQNNEHWHLWWDFLGAAIGEPKGPGVQREDGLWLREFSGGTVAYNPPGKGPKNLVFDDARTRASEGRDAKILVAGTSLALAEKDGELFLHAEDKPAKPPAP